MEAFTYDGGLDVHHHIGLSGEPLQARIASIYGETPSAPSTANKIYENNVKHRQYQKEYMDYWNSTAKLTKSGNPVDAILVPVAPVAALQFGKFAYAGNNVSLFPLSAR
jgi:amidase